MFRRHPKLLIVPLVTASVAAPVALTKLFGGSHDAWSLLCVFLFFIGMLPLVGVMSRLEVDLEYADRERRLSPVKQSLKACGVMIGKELPYRNQVVQQLLQSLSVVSKPEAPLPSGTRVDAYMEFGEEDWYITIKRGLDNQKRLTLQGEVEDIILHAPRQDRDLWICIVVGLNEELDPKELSHFKSLCKYAAHRSDLDARAHRTVNEQHKPRVNIEVMHAIIPSPVEVGAATTELVPA